MIVQLRSSSICARLADALSRSIIICLVAAIIPIGCKPTTTVGLGPGDIPPPFSLTDTKGRTVKLSDFSGKVVLLNFWATWCAPCVRELPDLEKIYQDNASKGFTVVGISVEDSLDQVKEVVAKSGVTYPILLDTDGKIRDRFKVNGFPESFIVSSEGKLTLFPDPDSGTPLVRIVGPREWRSDEILKRIFAVGLHSPR